MPKKLLKQILIVNVQKQGRITLTLLPLIEARKLGYNLGILGSSEMGYRVYQSLGFKEYCKISQYMWQPED